MELEVRRATKDHWKFKRGACLGVGRESEGQMSNSNARRLLGIMIDFTFILSPLEILNINVLLKDKEKYRRARKS